MYKKGYERGFLYKHEVREGFTERIKEFPIWNFNSIIIMIYWIKKTLESFVIVSLYYLYKYAYYFCLVIFEFPYIYWFVKYFIFF